MRTYIRATTMIISCTFTGRPNVRMTQMTKVAMKMMMRVESVVTVKLSVFGSYSQIE